MRAALGAHPVPRAVPSRHESDLITDPAATRARLKCCCNVGSAGPGPRVFFRRQKATEGGGRRDGELAECILGWRGATDSDKQSRQSSGPR